MSRCTPNILDSIPSQKFLTIMAKQVSMTYRAFVLSPDKGTQFRFDDII
jgi:hypothetical protein